MTKVRDFMSGLTHCIGAVLSLAGLVVLICFASIFGDSYDIVSFTIFGITLILMYLFSTLYHWLNISEKGIKVFKKLDHIMIYVLIAGSYTPVCFGPLRGPWGWSIFGVVWTLAIFGTILSSIWISAPRGLTTSIYIGMGWLALLIIKPLIEVFNNSGLLYSLLWLVLGGILYTIGGIIYGLKIPKTKFKQFGFHEIFHIFVMLGSFCHYWFVLNYVIKV